MPDATGQPKVERRLAAILAADVVGYSRLMGKDDEGTHARLKVHWRLQPCCGSRECGLLLKHANRQRVQEAASITGMHNA
jgi:class 3 adenylate cyclase